MPPHARMSLTQQLLLRAMIARFWEEPYVPARLARWGTELHDRFMLPHSMSSRIFAMSWTKCRRRLPVQGGMVRATLRIPLSRNTATSRSRASNSNCATPSSPGMSWAKKAAVGGAVRYVDSSVERVQVKIRGHGAGSLCADLQWRAGAAAEQPDQRRVRRRRALSRLAAGLVPASDHRRRMRRWCSTWSIPGCSVRWAAVSTM